MNKRTDTLYTRKRSIWRGSADPAGPRPERGPRQDESKISHPFDELGQGVIEGRTVAFQTEFSNEAVVFVRPRVRS